MNRQRGFSLVTAMFILVVVALLGSYMVKLTLVQTATFNASLQGARAYQASRAAIEWSIARISNGGTCGDVNAQTAMSFSGLSGFSVRLTCSSQSYSEATSTLTAYRVDALATFGTYGTRGYVARELEANIVK